MNIMKNMPKKRGRSSTPKIRANHDASASSTKASSSSPPVLHFPHLILITFASEFEPFPSNFTPKFATISPFLCIVLTLHSIFLSAWCVEVLKVLRKIANVIGVGCSEFSICGIC